jgi:hypothetical protein
MDDEVKIQWILAYAAKAFRGDISSDCASFADKAVECYEARFSVDLDQASNEEWDGM